MNILDFNDATLKLYEVLEPSSILNLPFYNISQCEYSHFTQEQIEGMTQHIISSGNYAFQVPTKTQKQNEFFADINVSVLTFENVNYFIVNVSDITQEVNNRKELEQTKEAYKSIYNKLPNGVITHANGKIRTCNETFLSYVDIARRDLYGTNFIELFNPDDKHLVQQQIDNPVKGEILIVRGLKKDDLFHKYTIESFKEKLFEQEIVVSFISDYQLQEDFSKEQLRANIASEANALLEKEIEKHKETRIKLEESQEISKSVFNSSIDTIISTNLNNVISEVSPSACYTFGYQMEELLGLKSSNLYAIESEFKEIEKQLKEEGFYIGEITNKRKDGSLFTSFLSCAAMKNNNGDQIGFMGISRDITDIKKAEFELIESEKKYRDLFVNLSDAVIVVDSNNLILELNRAAKHLFQIKDNKEYNLMDFVLEEDKNFFHKKSKEFRKKGNIVNVEFRIKTKKGFIRTVNLSSSAIFSGNNFIGSRDIIRDITEQKEAEYNLNKSIKEKEVLLKEVHHRVKNNLQVISSILNLQSSYVKDQNTLTILRESQNRVKSMSFIHESLYRSKDFSEVNFSDYVNNLVNNIIHSFHLSNSNVQLITDLGAVNLNLDQAIPCGLIINELLTNAMKYAYEGIENPELFIGISQENNLISICVSDNGIGLPEGFKIDESDSLGLQLVQTLMEQLEGTLILNNEKGTKYFITFEKVT
jgi:PAS domain S-box-containing protein